MLAKGGRRLEAAGYPPTGPQRLPAQETPCSAMTESCAAAGMPRAAPGEAAGGRGNDKGAAILDCALGDRPSTGRGDAGDRLFPQRGRRPLVPGRGSWVAVEG